MVIGFILAAVLIAILPFISAYRFFRKGLQIAAQIASPEQRSELLVTPLNVRNYMRPHFKSHHRAVVRITILVAIFWLGQIAAITFGEDAVRQLYTDFGPVTSIYMLLLPIPLAVFATHDMIIRICEGKGVDFMRIFWQFAIPVIWMVLLVAAELMFFLKATGLNYVIVYAAVVAVTYWRWKQAIAAFAHIP